MDYDTRPKTLVDLPRELRDMIWEYAVIETYPVEPLIFTSTRSFAARGTWKTKSTWKSKLNMPPIAQVSSTFRFEVLDIYLAGNTFDLTAWDKGRHEADSVRKILARWRKVLGDRLKLVQAVQFTCNRQGEVLRFPNLHSSVVRVHSESKLLLTKSGSCVFEHRIRPLGSNQKSTTLPIRKDICICDVQTGSADLNGDGRGLDGTALIDVVERLYEVREVTSLFDCAWCGQARIVDAEFIALSMMDTGRLPTWFWEGFVW